MTLPVIELIYRRLPDRTQVFRQLVLEMNDDYVVTLLEAAGVQRPLLVGGRVVLEPGAPVVWFTYPDAWFDIGRFHLRDGTFTGLYANILTPVTMDGPRWETTDLCLDIWVGCDGELALLDEDEFVAARTAGWLDFQTAQIARSTAAWFMDEVRSSRFPPAHVHDWPLSRAWRLVGNA